MDMVPREEFEAIKELAQKARAEQEDLTAKVAALEQKVAAMSAAPQTARRAEKTTRRPAVKATGEPKAGAATRRRAPKAKPAD
jgi:hypothetical protein